MKDQLGGFNDISGNKLFEEQQKYQSLLSPELCTDIAGAFPMG